MVCSIWSSVTILGSMGRCFLCITGINFLMIPPFFQDRIAPPHSVAGKASDAASGEMTS